MLKKKPKINYKNRSKIPFEKMITLYNNFLPTTKIAKIAGISATRVHRILTERGVPMRTKEEVERLKRRYNYEVIVEDYEKGMSVVGVSKKYGADVSFVNKLIKANATSYRGIERLRGEKHPNWKGGNTHTGGYIRKKSGWLHRLEVEKIIGRKLKHWEDVHHLDGNKLNYKLNNLVVLPSREHIRFHTFLRQAKLEINNKNLEDFCRKENEYSYRFTKVDLKNACKKSGVVLKSINKKKRRICRIVGCDGLNAGHGYCSKHYQRVVAKKRGYWLSSKGRRSKFFGKY